MPAHPTDPAAPVPFTRHSQWRWQVGAGGGADRLAILLPGLSYGCDQPLLAEPAALLRARGYDLVCFDFLFASDPDFMALPDAQQFAVIEAECAQIAQLPEEFAPSAEVVLVGKSLGTLAMAAALAQWRGPAVRAIWMTPSLLGTPLLEQMVALPQPSLVVIGDRDPSYAPDPIAALQDRPNMELITIPGADHGFTGTAEQASSDLVAQAMGAIVRWL